MLPLVIRAMAPHELVMVLANWKSDIERRYVECFRHRFELPPDKCTHAECSHPTKTEALAQWGLGMNRDEFWALVNHAVERISLPSSVVYIGCHPGEDQTPLCWASVREGQILHLYARKSIREEPELAATMEREFLSMIEERIGPTVRAHYNPFQELRR